MYSGICSQCDEETEYLGDIESLEIYDVCPQCANEIQADIEQGIDMRSAAAPQKSDDSI